MASSVTALPTHPRYVLAVLSLISLINYIDRQVLSILLDQVKADLQATDTAMGLLTGTAFSLCYVLASMPIARLADRRERRSILACCVAVWSIMTGVCGLAQTYVQLALARATVAFAESGAIPISQSLLSDIFPASQRATVFGIITAMGAVGIAFGLFLGGWISDMFNWRVAFFIVAAPGIVMALLLRFTTNEPARRLDNAQAARPALTIAATAEVLGANKGLRWLLLATGLAGFTTYAMLGWAPTFFIREHGMSASQVGFGMGIATIVGQAGGHFLAGLCSDRLARRDPRWYAWFAAIGTLGAIPCALAFLFLKDPMVCLAAFAAMQIFKSAWLAPTYAMAYRITPGSMRAQVSALITACLVLVGLGLGPLFVGGANDVLTAFFGGGAIRYSLALVTLIFIPLSIVYLAIAARADLSSANDHEPVSAL